MKYIYIYKYTGCLEIILVEVDIYIENIVEMMEIKLFSILYKKKTIEIFLINKE